MNMHPPHRPKYRISGSAHFRPMALLATAITNVVTCRTDRALVAGLVAKIALLVFRTDFVVIFVAVVVVVAGAVVVVVAKFVLITCSC